MIKSEKQPTISDIVNKINVDGPLGLTDSAEVLSDDVLNKISDAFTTVNGYLNPDSMITKPANEIQNDIIYLQALQVFISNHTSMLSAYADSLDDELKVARAKARAQAKDINREGKTRLTAEDYKDISYIATEDLRQKLEAYRQSSEFCKFIYYTLKDHIMYLEKAVHRFHQRGE